MCFYNDYAWVAAVSEEAYVNLYRPIRCLECRRQMEPGEIVWKLHLQEHEECHACYGFDIVCNCPKDEDGECMGCQCKKPNFGEEFTDYTCIECHLFLDAVEEHEKDEGCPIDTRRPSVGCLVESLGDMEHKEADPYFAEAVAMHPELESSGYLVRLQTLVFGESE